MRLATVVFPDAGGPPIQSVWLTDTRLYEPRYTRSLTRPGRVFPLSRVVSADHTSSTRSCYMARGDVRIAVTLACEECKRRNYQTEKSKRNDPDRIELRKYCRWCGRHTPHKETR